MAQETTIHESRIGRILEYPVDGSPLGNVSAALEIISDARSQWAEIVAIPVERLGDEFFNLRNGIAGEALQKFVTYHLRVAIVGDILRLSSASKAMHDFVVECNRGTTVWFVGSLEQLMDRICKKPQDTSV
jgi:Domain of unknown function (DUF4180)